MNYERLQESNFENSNKAKLVQICQVWPSPPISGRRRSEDLMYLKLTKLEFSQSEVSSDTSGLAEPTHQWAKEIRGPDVSEANEAGILKICSRVNYNSLACLKR